MQVINRVTRGSILSKINELRILDNIENATVEVFSEHRSKVVVRLEDMLDRFESKKVDIKPMKEKANIIEYARDASAFGAAAFAALALPATVPAAAAGGAVLVATTILIGSWVNRTREFHEMKKGRAENREMHRTISAVTDIINDLSRLTPAMSKDGGLEFSGKDYADKVEYELLPTASRVLKYHDDPEREQQLLEMPRKTAPSA
jgi:hypothetical protein